MNIENSIEFLVGLVTLIGFIYRISQVQSKLYQAIDSTGDELSKRVNKLEKEFSIHVSDNSARDEMRDFRIHGLNEKIDHKFKRCWDEIKILTNKACSQKTKD